MPPLRCIHLRGILWVIFRVLLVGFGLFGPGVARTPGSPIYMYNISIYSSIKITP